MARDGLRSSKTTSLGISGLGIALYWGLTAGGALLAWRLLHFSLAHLGIRWWWTAANLFGVLAVQALLTLVCERSLTAFRIINRGWRFRIAFLSSLALALSALFASWLALQNQIAVQFTPDKARTAILALVFAALTGAFLGAVSITALTGSLWENNSPPSERVRQDVYAIHHQALGDLPPVGGPKRWFDFILALGGLLISSPVWLACCAMIWFEDPGPVLFVKNSVGKGGRNFHQFKFRTMILGAEDGTGPIRSYEGDERVLRCGRFLRKTALDELPQLLNILRGEMSFVGPRPQRTVLVRSYLESLPAYVERHRVLPGLAGLAQVAGDYYLTPRQKLRFDRVYIQHSSLSFDLKLILLAFLLTFWFRWQKGWTGRLPRRILRLGDHRAGNRN